MVLKNVFELNFFRVSSLHFTKISFIVVGQGPKYVSGC